MTLLFICYLHGEDEQRYLWNSVQFFTHRVALLFLQRLYSQNDEWGGELEPNLFLMHVTAACLSHQ